MMEIQWGQPLVLISPQDGEAERFGTIEKANYWLRRKWPISDRARDTAMDRIESAMDCMVPVEEARRAFLLAAVSAGFKPGAAM
ncbi:DUF982 domain-containing protein [Seohaeicola zhoushanensis]|uniref:DUF982 domain-containing protein n=1 Tax=Seohaeicola zhoushanensis TaxID=1569283 RepID=A0A8J3M9A0_9RHOB|nr:DUF982 domain-containing protein [Seohaeicola zhoushanensis]GHF66353.1 hypothetical protein GCM10017056_41920 [Seohaeicola zhoushanensis]